MIVDINIVRTSLLLVDFPGCWDIVSWCKDRENVEKPPFPTDFDSDLTCGYVTDTHERSNDPCRKEVVPAGEEALSVAFSCQDTYIQKWSGVTPDATVKMWTCEKNSEGWENPAGVPNSWPYCGK